MFSPSIPAGRKLDYNDAAPALTSREGFRK